MSLTTWHPPPISHVGFSSHTSNSDYGRWSNLPSNHYSSVALATTPSSPWQSRKFSVSDNNYDFDIFGSNGTLSLGRQPEKSSNITSVTVNDRTSYPYTTDVRKNLLSSNNNNNNKNETTKTVLYSYSDPTILSSRSRSKSASSHNAELYSTNEPTKPSYKTNFTTTVKSTVNPWNQTNRASNNYESQKDLNTSPSWRSVKPGTTTASTYSSEPTSTRGYELYSDSSSGRSTGVPAPTTTLYTTSAPGRTSSLGRSSSFHGPASTPGQSTVVDSEIGPYSSVTSRTVRDKLDSWGNDRQNASIVNAVIPYNTRDSLLSSTSRDASQSLLNGRNHITYRAASEPREITHSSTRSDPYGSYKPHTYESYNQGLGLSRPTSGVGQGYGTLEKSAQQKFDELNLGINNMSSAQTGSSSLANKLRAPESPRSLLAPLSPRSSSVERSPTTFDWDRYLTGDRSATAPSGAEKPQPPTGDRLTFDHRHKSASTIGRRPPKSILKKKSAYETVSGAESWKTYFQESELSGFGLHRQNTMPTMRHSSRAPLPQLTRKSSGRRVHFAV